MPESINSKHMNRIFPFEFYSELNEQLRGYVLTNPAFLLNTKEPLTQERRKELFAKSRTEEIFTRINQNNILEVEPFGELLHLELCAQEEYVEQLLGSPTERSQVPLSILVGQLYDSSDQPVFSKEVTDETISQIPEVLWDDPNLLLAVVSFSQTETTIGVIQIPKHLEASLFEHVECDDQKA